jgi:hypothetical protein
MMPQQVIVAFHPSRWFIIPTREGGGVWTRLYWLCVEVTITRAAKPSRNLMTPEARAAFIAELDRERERTVGPQVARAVPPLAP